MRAAVGWDAFNDPSQMDGDPSICITGLLGLLVDVVSIPPLPILVAIVLGLFWLDDCCTKRSLIPLTLSNSLVYYQPCYYCKNATRTIISLDPILATSDTLVHWTQKGHKGNAPGAICFMSNSGLYSIILELKNEMNSTTVPLMFLRWIKIPSGLPFQ
jgi:hypothetical protein